VTHDAAISVVVASNGAVGSVERFLEAVAESIGDDEVVACSPTQPSADLRRRHPRVRWHVREGALVPVLWRDGIELAAGELVALTISPMVPRPGWLPALRAALASADAVGGAIEPGAGLRIVDDAECFSRYAKDMLPFAAGPSLDLPGDNAGYRRAGLRDVADSWRDGFWEPDVHRALAARGASLVRDPSVVVEMGRSAGARAFVRQRLRHGREYGRSRGARFGTLRNVAGIVLVPIVPLLLVARTLREARRRGRAARFVRVLPLVLLFDAAWAVGEARGHMDALRSR